MDNSTLQSGFVTNANMDENGTSNLQTSMSENAQTAYLIWKVFPPILIVVGTIGNILSIVVLCQKTMRRSGVSMYLICLAVSDLLVLYSGLLRQWIIYTFQIDFRESHPALCKLNMWMVYFSLDLSSWILVSVTIERTISVWLPHKVKFICTRKAFVVNITLLVIFLLVLNGHFLFGVGDLILDGKTYFCSNLSRKYAEFLDYVFPWVDLCFFCLVPFLVLVVGNVLIISRVVSGVRTMSQFNLTSTEQRTERKRQTSSMTTMLISLNFMYLICTLPISIHLIYTGYWEADQSPEARDQRRLVYACVNLLMYLNNSTNFITYAASGKRFRAELYALFRGGRYRDRASFTLSNSGHRHGSEFKSSNHGGSISTIT